MSEMPDQKQAFVQLISTYREKCGDAVALCEACRHGLFDIVEGLLNEGVDPNSSTPSGMNMITPGLVPLMYSKNRKTSELLVQRGASVHARDLDGNTPLIWFLRGNSPRGEAKGYLKWILSVGANPDDVSNSGESAREMALKRFSLDLDNLDSPVGSQDKSASASFDKDVTFFGFGKLRWMYFTKYQADVEKALQELQTREFEAGRYFPVMEYFLDDDNAEKTGSTRKKKYKTLRAAFAAAGEEGTRSILDMSGISSKPESGQLAYPVDPEKLIEWYDTEKPTREMLEEDQSFFKILSRLEGCCIIVYKDGQPDEIMFAGCSAD